MIIFLLRVVFPALMCIPCCVSRRGRKKASPYMNPRQYLFPFSSFSIFTKMCVRCVLNYRQQRKENRQAGLLLLLLLMFAVGVELRSLISEGGRADKVRPSWGTSPNKMHPPQSPQVLKEN